MAKRLMTNLFAVLLAGVVLCVPVAAANSWNTQTLEMEATGLEQLDPKEVTITKRSVIVYNEDVAVSHVGEVYFDEKEVTHRTHYTVYRREDGGLAVTFRQSFLDRYENGEYNIYIEYAEHSLETTFTVNNANSRFNQEPPRTRSIR